MKKQSHPSSASGSSKPHSSWEDFSGAASAADATGLIPATLPEDSDSDAYDAILGTPVSGASSNKRPQHSPKNGKNSPRNSG